MQTYGLKINYDAIRALNPNGSNVQSNDGEVWEIVKGESTMRYVVHVNFNGTMSGLYVHTYKQL